MKLRRWTIWLSTGFVWAAWALTPLHGEDWPHWRGPDRNGVSKETGWLTEWPADGPTVAWRASVSVGFSSVSVAGGRAYTMGNRDDTDTVHCLDAGTGKSIWRHAYACPLEAHLFEGGPTSTPTVDGGRVYTFSRRGDLFCFDAATGKVHWQTNVHEQTEVRLPGWGYAGSPLVHGDLLVLNVGEHGAAVNKQTGKVVWASADKDAGYATPLPYLEGQRACVVIASAKYIFGVDILTGKERWRYRWLTRYGVNAADPILAGDGRVFISSGYNKGATLLKLAGDEPQELWRNKAMRNQLSSSVLVDGHLYGLDGDAGGQAPLNCVELNSGEVKWSHPGLGGSLTAADGKLIVLTEQGELIVAPASPTGFHPSARAQVLQGKCWTVPVLAGGRVYCRNAEGDLVCLDLRRAADP